MEIFPLVSIIIPVFNTVSFLRECVNSVIRQTYSNLEIILVDDGSTDGSSFLCDELSSNDNRIIVIHKNNAGLSEARNTGINISKGDYLLFLDSDDFWMHKDGLAKLVNIVIERNYECLCFNCYYYYYALNKYKPWNSFSESLLQCANKELAIKLLISSGTFPMSACLKIICRSFLINNKLYFQKDLYSEDIPWFLSLLSNLKSVGFVNEYFYAYRKGVNGSISSSFSEKKFNDLYIIFKSGLENIKSYTWNNNISPYLLSFWAYEYCILLGYSHYFKNKTKCNSILKELKQYTYLLKYHYNPKVRKVYYLYKLAGFKILSFCLYSYLRKVLKVSS